MAFIKVQKNSSYYRRFQVKYRRRREGKTDYYARRILIAQDKNKYNTPKYRFVARLTNTQVICQIVKATIEGDVIVTSAYSTELPRFGITFGLKNYAAAYATGLLAARRLLAKFGLDKTYKGVAKVTGEVYHVEAVEDKARPFRALLDVGLVRTSTGARVFGAMKGAVDGGLDIPHKEKRFPGWDAEKKSFEPSLLRKMIFGGHVADYMRWMQENDADKFSSHFSAFLKSGKKADDVEGIYAKAHAAIRADPSHKPTTKKAKNTTHHPHRAVSLAQRRSRVQQKLAHRGAGKPAAAAASESSSEDDS